MANLTANVILYKMPFPNILTFISVTEINRSIHIIHLNNDFLFRNLRNI